MTGTDERKDQFFALAERYCKLGRLLPAVEEIDVNDVAELAGLKTVLAEMAKTETEMDALLGSHARLLRQL